MKYSWICVEVFFKFWAKVHL